MQITIQIVLDKRDRLLFQHVHQSAFVGFGHTGTEGITEVCHRHYCVHRVAQNCRLQCLDVQSVAGIAGDFQHTKI